MGLCCVHDGEDKRLSCRHRADVMAQKAVSVRREFIGAGLSRKGISEDV